MNTVAPILDFRIVVPVFNEAKMLEVTLARIKKAGYLNQISFVNDASTDSSRNILKKWGIALANGKIS